MDLLLPAVNCLVFLLVFYFLTRHTQQLRMSPKCQIRDRSSCGRGRRGFDSSPADTGLPAMHVKPDGARGEIWVQLFWARDEEAQRTECSHCDERVRNMYCSCTEYLGVSLRGARCIIFRQAESIIQTCAGCGALFPRCNPRPPCSSKCTAARSVDNEHDCFSSNCAENWIAVHAPEFVVPAFF